MSSGNITQLRGIIFQCWPRHQSTFVYCYITIQNTRLWLVLHASRFVQPTEHDLALSWLFREQRDINLLSYLLAYLLLDSRTPSKSTYNDTQSEPSAPSVVSLDFYCP